MELREHGPSFSSRTRCEATYRLCDRDGEATYRPALLGVEIVAAARGQAMAVPILASDAPSRMFVARSIARLDAPAGFAPILPGDRFRQPTLASIAAVREPAPTFEPPTFEPESDPPPPPEDRRPAQRESASERRARLRSAPLVD